MHYTAELRYVKLQPLVQQLIAARLFYMPARRRVVIDLQPVRPQIQHPLHQAIAAAHYKRVHHLLHKLQTPFTLASGQAAIALIRTVAVKII